MPSSRCDLGHIGALSRRPRLRRVSVRIYTGPRAAHGGGPSKWVGRLPWAFAALAIAAQIGWILVDGDTRTTATLVGVVLFFLASASHAVIMRGAVWGATCLAITLSFGWFVEAVGLATSFPFGTYEYSDVLGPAIGGVPVLIPMAWSMMAYPCLLAVQRLSSTAFGTALLGGWLLAAWDLFLDPQMTGEGYWTWGVVGWALPGIDGVPLQNFLGWLLAAIVLMGILCLLPRKVADDTVPTVLLIWVYASSVLANLVFLHRPAVAIWGGLCMGAVIVPWLWRIWSQPRW